MRASRERRDVTSSVLVAGGGGFIGGHLVSALLAAGNTVRAVDGKPLEEWHQLHADADNRQADLSVLDQARDAVRGVNEVYDLAADMGGMGFIESHKAACMLSVLTGTHLLLAARDAGCDLFFYASSACVYAAAHQDFAERHPAEGVRCLPSHARGRVWLGEALYGANVPTLP